MSNSKQNQIITIDGTEYDANDFTEQQRMLLEHCLDLDRKLASCKFQLDQLNVGKDAFLQMLKNSLQTNTIDVV